MINKLLAVIFAILLAFAMLFTVLYVECISPLIMEGRFESFAKARGDYGQLAKDITGYLNGSKIELSFFQAHEQAHMKDVQGLISLLKTVLWVLWPGVLLLGFFLLKKPLCKTIAITLSAVLGLVLCVVIYGMVDFNGLFILFHQLAFTNDLWLLNPYTDYLIQLMPIGFFMAYALSVGLIWLLLMVTAILFNFRAQRRNHGVFFLFKRANGKA